MKTSMSDEKGSKALKLSGLYLLVGYGIYLCLHLQTGVVAPLSDDFRQISFTESMDSFLGCFRLESFGMFRPVKSILFYAVVKGGLPYEAFQWIGAIMAGLCLIVTFCLLRRIFQSPHLAVCGALVWLFLPLNVVIFNWASALNVGGYYFFSLLSLLLAESYLKASCRSSQWILLALCCLAYAWALLSYEMALSVPLLIALYIFVFLRECRKFSLYLWLGGGLIAVTLVYLSARSMLLSGATATISGNQLIGQSEWWELSLASSWSYVEHLRFLFWPFSGFEFLIPFDPRAHLVDALLAWACIAASVLLSLKYFSQFRYALFAWLWSALALATVLNVIPIGAGPLAEYYMPLAAIGWVVVFLAILQKYVANLLGRVLLAALLLVLFGVETGKRESLWGSEASLYAGVVEASERAHAPYALLSQIRLGAGRSQEALQLVEQAMEMAPANVDYVGLWLSILLKGSQPLHKLAPVFEEALRLYPNDAPILLAWGDYLIEMQDSERAELIYQQAYTQAKTKYLRATALNNLGLIEVARGNLLKAEAYFGDAHLLKPQDSSIRQNYEQVQEDLSLEHFQKI